MLGAPFVEAYLDDNLLNRGLAKMEARLKKAGAALANIGAKLAVGGALTLAPVASTFVAFDDAMRLVKATSQATEAEFASLTAHARELGRTTSFTADQVANLMVELARAGFKPAEVQQMTLAVLDLARATGTDATEAAGFMAATLRQFSLGAGDATRVADALTQTANSTFNSVTDLGYALKYSGTVAGDLGMSLEDTLALLGGLGQVNIRGEMGGTTLRRLLTLTASEADKFQKVFGVAAKDAAGNVRPLVDVMDEVHTLLQTMGTADANEKLNEFFGLLGITGASVVGRTSKSIKEIRDEIGNAGGVARQTAKEMDAGLGGEFRRLKGSVVDAAIALGGAFAPALGFVATVLKGAANSISSWVANNKEAAATIGVVVVSLTALGVALLAAGIAFKVLGVAVGVVSTALTLTTTLIGALLTPIGLVSAAIAGLSVMLIEGQGWTEFSNTAKEAWDGIVAALQKGDLNLAWEIVCAGLNLEWQKVMMFWRAAFEDFTSFFRNKWEDTTDAMAVALARVFDAGAFDVGAGFAFGFDAKTLIRGVKPGPKLADAVAEDAARAEKERLARQARERAAALKPFEDAIRAAEAKFKGLVDKAKAPGFETGPMPREMDIAPMPRAVMARMNRLAAGIPDAVRGAFAVSNARGQFGMGFERRQLNAAERTAKATEATARLNERLILALAFK